MTVLETTYNATKGEQPRLPCETCVASTFHLVLASVDDKVGFLTQVGSAYYQIVQCQGCRMTTFRKLTKTPDFSRPPSDSRRAKRIKPVEELYPPRNIGRRALKESKQLPEAVGRIYAETFKALIGNQPVLTGIGIRALIETVCKERSAAGRNLQEKIDNLVSLGLLTRDNADFLHGLRILGNEAAHEVIPHSEEKLGIAMEVIEHLLRTVYLLPAKATKLLNP